MLLLQVQPRADAVGIRTLPPNLAAVTSSRIILVKILPRLASLRSFTMSAPRPIYFATCHYKYFLKSAPFQATLMTNLQSLAGFRDARRRQAAGNRHRQMSDVQ